MMYDIDGSPSLVGGRMEESKDDDDIDNLSLGEIFDSDFIHEFDGMISHIERNGTIPDDEGIWGLVGLPEEQPELTDQTAPQTDLIEQPAQMRDHTENSEEQWSYSDFDGFQNFQLTPLLSEDVEKALEELEEQPAQLDSSLETSPEHHDVVTPVTAPEQVVTAPAMNPATKIAPAVLRNKGPSRLQKTDDRRNVRRANNSQHSQPSRSQTLKVTNRNDFGRYGKNHRQKTSYLPNDWEPAPIRYHSPSPQRGSVPQTCHSSKVSRKETHAISYLPSSWKVNNYGTSWRNPNDGDRQPLPPPPINQGCPVTQNHNNLTSTPFPQRFAQPIQQYHQPAPPNHRLAQQYQLARDHYQPAPLQHQPANQRHDLGPQRLPPGQQHQFARDRHQPAMQRHNLDQNIHQLVDQHRLDRQRYQLEQQRNHLGRPQHEPTPQNQFAHQRHLLNKQLRQLVQPHQPRQQPQLTQPRQHLGSQEVQFAQQRRHLAPPRHPLAQQQYQHAQQRQQPPKLMEIAPWVVPNFSNNYEWTRK